MLIVQGQVPGPRNSASVASRRLSSSNARGTADALRLRFVDATGRRHTLADYTGHVSKIWFMCGCVRCRAVAELLATTGVGLHANAGQHDDRSIIIYAGLAREALEFEAVCGLDSARVIAVPDVNHNIRRCLHVGGCPRAFVMDYRATTLWAVQVQARRRRASMQYNSFRTPKCCAKGRRPPAGRARARTIERNRTRLRQMTRILPSAPEKPPSANSVGFPS